MLTTRRHIGTAAAGLASAVAMTGTLSTSSLADDAADVNKAVDALRKAMLDGDTAALKDLLSDQITYVHSSGKVENKAEVLDIVGGKKTVYKTITIEDENNQTEIHSDAEFTPATTNLKIVSTPRHRSALIHPTAISSKLRYEQHRVTGRRSSFGGVICDRLASSAASSPSSSDENTRPE